MTTNNVYVNANIPFIYIENLLSPCLLGACSFSVGFQKKIFRYEPPQRWMSSDANNSNVLQSFIHGEHLLHTHRV